ncbi:[protein-PII] uridylyltransferase [Rhodobacterales bacterium 52_120_T64]|nr:[protein-PII] uridylyltransferase [Rhodobacterales bacterium 52_120_T64]
MALNIEKIKLGELIGSPIDILDPKETRLQLEATMQDASDAADIRARAVAILKQATSAGRDKIAEELRTAPHDAPNATKAYTYLTDEIVKFAVEVAVRWLHPQSNLTAGEAITVMAVGGYGRAEMAPFSDVDLLFLTPYKQTAWGESVIESILYTLWDLRMKVGHAVRTVNDCIRLGREDITIRTALLEHRYITGDERVATDLEVRLWQELFKDTGAEFVEAKLEERDSRHQRHGSSRYMVEPNIKEGKGGLRDLQTLFWIAKYLYHAKDSEELVVHGVFTPEEYKTFIEAEAFLWTVRCHLHLIANRAVEQLTFDMQVEIADALGFRDTEGRRAVEHFMQVYFRHATHVGNLTRIFLTALEARHVKSNPSIGRKFLNVFSFGQDKAAKGYNIKHGRLDISDADAFLGDPVNILRLFDEALRSEILIHPDAMRLIARNLDLIDQDLRKNPEAQQIFLSILLEHGNPERGLLRMNELGVLGALIPEFERIVAMMQFNMYHHYTVDEHTIRCISTLANIENGELVEDLPVASAILKTGVNRRILYIALLLHDIGKGLPEEHEIVGAKMARVIAPRLGLDPAECETVEWLVLNHLLMSDVAQKRDLSDPRTVRDFANVVQSNTRLKLLLALTVCDIRGVGPGVWNNWKAMLLRDLYSQTRDMLMNGQQIHSGPKREAEAQEALVATLNNWSDADIETECNRHYRPYWLGLDTETHKIFAELTRTVKAGEPVSDIVPDVSRDATRACFVMPDHPGIFARFAGALALAGANVVDARTYTSSDGLATAVFWIQDGDGKPYDETRLSRLRKMILRILRGEVIAQDALRSKDKIKKRERDFIVPTSVIFDNDGSEIFTIIEVDTRDRTGLLFDLARTLTDSGVYISSAIIATYGEQAVDAFYVKDLFGLKVHSADKQRSIEKRLIAAIERAQKGAFE